MLLQKQHEYHEMVHDVGTGEYAGIFTVRLALVTVRRNWCREAGEWTAGLMTNVGVSAMIVVVSAWTYII